MPYKDKTKDAKYHRDYARRNRAKRNAYSRLRYQCGLGDALRDTNAGREEYRRMYREKNRERILAQHRAAYRKNKEERRAYARKHAARTNFMTRERRKQDGAEINRKRRELYREDLNFRLSLVLRARLCSAVRSSQRKAVLRKRKAGSAVRDLGCSVKELAAYLESKFLPGMTWSNWGTAWHIDHIRPLASFDLTVREDVLKACHYTNLQPLWAEENFRKNAKVA
jgi:hypothetical protein